LSRNAIYERVRSHARRARIVQRVSPHRLRQNAERREMPSWSRQICLISSNSRFFSPSTRHFQSLCKKARSLSLGR